MRTSMLAAAAVMFCTLASPAMAQDIGVPSCDAFLKTYESCLMTRSPEAQRSTMKTTLDQVRANWKAVGATAEGKAQLVSVCQQTAERLKKETAAVGCQW